MEELQKRTNENFENGSWSDVLPERISIWHIVGGVALAGLAAVVVVTLPDIKRYIRISTM